MAPSWRSRLRWWPWTEPPRDPVRHYLERHQTRRLHLGCGRHLLEGWLNCDVRPRDPNVVQVDATKRFPFEAGQFDCIFGEHMIEHLPFDGGALMLAECYRVLRPGGRIRVSTPDLGFVISLYSHDWTALQERYIRWAVSSTSKSHVRPPEDSAGSAPPEVFVINNFMRDWGHQFIYDERTLRYAFERAGFSNIVKCRLGESGCEALRNLENESRLPDRFLELETFTLEAEK